MTVNMTELEGLLNRNTLESLFPAGKADQFFEALYGDATEGAYDISVSFLGEDPDRKTLNFAFELHQRPGKCLACSLTFGLTQVFTRHPVINVKGFVSEVQELLNGQMQLKDWKLGPTRILSNSLHVVPLEIAYLKTES